MSRRTRSTRLREALKDSQRHTSERGRRKRGWRNGVRFQRPEKHGQRKQAPSPCAAGTSSSSAASARQGFSISGARLHLGRRGSSQPKERAKIKIKFTETQKREGRNKHASVRRNPEAAGEQPRPSPNPLRTVLSILRSRLSFFLALLRNVQFS